MNLSKKSGKREDISSLSPEKFALCDQIVDYLLIKVKKILEDSLDSINFTFWSNWRDHTSIS
jgi:hypothetical protein